jgi:hypothetical protein
MIIRKNKSDMPMKGMDEEGADNAPDASQDSAETAEIPSSIIGDQKVEAGDKIQLTVVSVNADSGMITVTYDHDSEGDTKPSEGSDSLASQFGQPQSQS